MTVWELVKEMETLKEEIVVLIMKKRLTSSVLKKEMYDKEITLKENRIFDITTALREVRINC